MTAGPRPLGALPLILAGVALLLLLAAAGLVAGQQQRRAGEAVRAEEQLAELVAAVEPCRPASTPAPSATGPTPPPLAATVRDLPSPPPDCRLERLELAARRLGGAVARASLRMGGYGRLPATPRLTALLLDCFAGLTGVQRADVVLADRRVRRDEVWHAVPRRIIRLTRAPTGALAVALVPPPLRETPGAEGLVVDLTDGPVVRVALWADSPAVVAARPTIAEPAGVPRPEPAAAPGPAPEEEPADVEAARSSRAGRAQPAARSLGRWLARLRQEDGRQTLLLFAPAALLLLLAFGAGLWERRTLREQLAGPEEPASSPSGVPAGVPLPEEPAVAEPWLPLTCRTEPGAGGRELRWCSDRAPVEQLTLAASAGDDQLLLVGGILAAAAATVEDRALRERAGQRVTERFRTALVAGELEQLLDLARFLTALDDELRWASACQLGLRVVLLRLRPDRGLVEVATLGTAYPWVATGEAPPVPLTERLAAEYQSERGLVRAARAPLLPAERLLVADRVLSSVELHLFDADVLPTESLAQPAVVLRVGAAVR
ncbi:MAG: hypothetical protein RBU45_07140 [Myxococcota bacterium]|nr:hypothetical protein [Myxococcota bacterium]